MTHLLLDYGLVLLFLLVAVESAGVPLPGETALITAAVLAHHHYGIWWVIVVAAAAAIVGDNVGYWIGRKAGRGVLTAPRGPFHRRRLALIAYGDRFFAKHGARAVFLGRWMALVRVTAAWMAGMNHMRFRTFFLWNALGGISWALGIGLVAYFAGNAAVHAIERVGVGAAIALGALIAGAVVWVQIRERRELREQQQEAEAEGAAKR